MKDTAIIVNSCDAFSDCWRPFIHSVRKYWNDCPWPVYIISNNNSISTPEGISFIKIGEDKKFASNLKKAIEAIDSEYIIYLQEDYFLNKNVDQKSIEQHLLYCKQNNVDYMRLGMPFIKGEPVECYSANKLTDKYALCLQAAIWKRSTLRSLLFEGWSGWDFEYKIQDYAIKQGMDIKIFGLRKECNEKGINYVTGTAVRKGKWTRSGYDFLKDEGFVTEIPKRGKEGYIFYHLQEIQGVFRLPALAIVKLMKKMKWNF